MGVRLRFSAVPAAMTVKIVLIPANGGSEHVLTEIRDVVTSEATLDSSLRKNLAWTPDGGWIAVRWREVDGSRGALLLISTLTGEKRPLTRPPTDYFDEHPSFSPDGRTLVFARSQVSVGTATCICRPFPKTFTPGRSGAALDNQRTGERIQVGLSDGSRIVYTSQM